MKVKVFRLYEDFGRPLGKWREGFLKGIVANLTMDEGLHKEWKRHTKTAKLTSLEAGVELFAHLDDADVLWILGNVMRITGTETDEVTRKEYKQTWHCELLL